MDVSTCQVGKRANLTTSADCIHVTDSGLWGREIITQLVLLYSASIIPFSRTALYLVQDITVF